MFTPDHTEWRRERAARKRRIKLLKQAGLGVAGALLVVGIVLGISRAMQSSRAEKSAALLRAAPNPLQYKTLYVNPQSNAAKQAERWQTVAPAKAQLMQRLAALPSSKWFAHNVTYDEVHNYVLAANKSGAIPVTVAYFLPQRDCGRYSSGGAASVAEYRRYIETYASAIGKLEAVVILEPDGVMQLQSNNTAGHSCLTHEQKGDYVTLLNFAIRRFKQNPSTLVYLDAGHSAWKAEMSQTVDGLQRSGIALANGFSINVSNFRTIDESLQYGYKLAQAIGGKHFVIDTSRNGLGPYTNLKEPNYNWCNPPDRALGHYPTTKTGQVGVDAYLYIKNVGESDGADSDPNKCFNGPQAGEWSPDYAAGLVERWPKDLQPPKSP